MCAAIAARTKARDNGIADRDFAITLFERNHRPGVTIRISGGGKCNVTHEGSVDQLLHKGFLRKAEQRFLRHALYAFSNEDIKDLLRKQGVRTVARDDGKVFPLSGMAEDVLRAFEKTIAGCVVTILSGERVKRIDKQEDIFSVCTERSEFRADAVIVATGGVSYPQTGTTGDGLEIARSFGHSIIQPSPALAPVYLKPFFPQSLAGVSLPGVVLTVSVRGKRVSRTGDLLITHKGISGPVCLSLSRDAGELLANGERGEVTVNFFPDRSPGELSIFLLDHGSAKGSQFIRKFLQEQAAIPSALISVIMRQAGVDPEEKWGNLTKTARRALEHTLQHFALGIVKTVPLDAGEVSAGGVALKEVNPKTMESRKCKNLFFLRRSSRLYR